MISGFVCEAANVSLRRAAERKAGMGNGWGSRGGKRLGEEVGGKTVGGAEEGSRRGKGRGKAEEGSGRVKRTRESGREEGLNRPRNVLLCRRGRKTKPSAGKRAQKFGIRAATADGKPEKQIKGIRLSGFTALSLIKYEQMFVFLEKVGRKRWTNGKDVR